MFVQHGTAWLTRGAERGAEEFGPLPEHAAPPTPGAKLREIGQIFLRRSRLVLLTLLVLNSIAILAVYHVKPRYTAEATLIIGPRQAQVLDLKGVLAGLTGESDVIESEIQVLRSRRIARAIVQQLHLDQNPEFNPKLWEPGLLTRLRDNAYAWWNALLTRLPPSWRLLAPATASSSAFSADATNTVSARDPLALTIDTVLRHLWVTPKGRSRVLAVAFDSSDPVLAAAAANAVADAYMADQLKTKLDATAHAQKWLNERVAELREQVINADQAVEAYRQRAGITQGRTSTLVSEQISTLGEQVMQARLARANAEAKLQAIQGAMASPRGLDGLPETQGSVIIQALRAQESTLLQRAAEYSKSYGEQHPRVIAVRAEIADIEGRLRTEIAKVGAALQDEVRAARARETALSASLAGLRRDADISHASGVELRALEHEADANRALYDRLLARSRETSVEGGLQQPDAQMISRADPPYAPSFPKPAIILPIFFLASCIATVLLVLAVENLDHGFASLEQIEQVLGITALGIVPQLKRSITSRRAPGAYILEHPASAFGESIRSLHTSLMLSNVDQPPKVVLVASSLPGEGKTSVVLALARLMASCGKRVAIVDCDLRRPDLHKAFGVSRSPGLIDCLSGKTSVFDVLRCDTDSHAYLVPAGSKAHTSPDLFASANMRKLIATLSDRFDLVLLDSAPVMAVSDTRNLCRLADRTVFMVRWQDTRRFAALPALRQIIEAGGNVAGVLLSMVDLNQYSKYYAAGFYQRRIGFYMSE